LTDCALCDELDAGCIQGGHELRERIDVAANDAVACLHALNGRERQSSELGQLSLVDSKQGSSASQLGGCNHVPDINT
jgi:hypothetical protein